jgi:hypothetical protein
MAKSENNINRASENLHTDNSFVDQPKGTTRFVLNGVNETKEGDRMFIANEEANEACYTLPEGYIPLGEEYIGDGETVILSVSPDETISEIGIADSDCNYTTIVNDVDSINKLGFKISNQIDITYRLRRGCEKTIYFVDGDNNKPRYFNFAQITDFQDNNGLWDAFRFELIRSYRSVPRFETIEVLDSGGQLEPGSYNISIQYLDDDLNPTEWITTSGTINIYNDDLSDSYLDIRGSINSDDDFRDYPITNKSIKVQFNNLDNSFPFFRLAFIEASTGTGIVNAVNFSDQLPTANPTFVYTGTNAATEGTEEEILAFQLIIDGADNIEQIENTLLMGNVIGKQVNFCNLQKYASRIKTDMVTRKVFHNVISDGNPKNPTVSMEAAGYQPGEIYSFAIVYVFADGSLTPAYHIPGKNSVTSNDLVYKPGENVFPMRNENANQSAVYTDNGSCDDYWGVDCDGIRLLNRPVRHHRFPLRSQIGLDLVNLENTINSSTTFYRLKVTATGIIDTPCTQEQVDAGECSPLTQADPFQARIEYTVDGQSRSFTININPSDYASENVTYDFSEEFFDELLTSDNIIIVSAEESDSNTATDITGGITSPKGLTYTIETIQADIDSEERVYSSDVYGIQFSGVELPTITDTGGEEIIGYYIVRNERKEEDKTVLDSAVLTPTVINEKYIAHGLMSPELSDQSKVSNKIYGMIHPEHKFKDKKYTNIENIIHEGSFNIVQRKKSKSRYLDVFDGTSFDPDIHKGGGGNDDDGWSLKAITRDNITDYRRESSFNKTDDEIEDIFYLNALESRDIDSNTSTVYNVSGDNRAGIVQLKDDDSSTNFNNKLPYVYLTRENSDPYANFRTTAYYKASVNIETADTVAVFGGDTYVTPMRYVNTMFWENRIALRAARTSFWNYVLGAALILFGGLLSILTLGLGSIGSTFAIASGIAILGGGALFVASGIKRDQLIKTYTEEYDKGLRETILDDWVDTEYRNPIGTYRGGTRSADTPQDDEIQWVADCVTDLWFESQINMSLRYGFVTATPTFLNAPGKIETGREGLEPIYEHFGVYKIEDNSLYPETTLDRHVMGKLSVFNPDRQDNREYIGHVLGEYYELNPDFERFNKQKIFNHLALEYNCCSDCQEDFPQRVHYSLQSFQEELTDNYRVFLPNNYRDIEGEKGVITNMYRMGNSLYIHTEEALWYLPQNYQERVTNDILSFLGTGSFFEVPPRPILDDSKVSAGTLHKWGCIKTKVGILFPSQVEKKWYLFDGKDLKPISDYGMSNWFKLNMESQVAKQYYKSNQRKYPFLNNPSNIFGEGFISTYDTEKERLIVTKKDFTLTNDLQNNPDYELCVNDGQVIVFNDFEQTIEQTEQDGWTYNGIEDCQLKFSKTEFDTVIEERQISNSIPNTADIHVFYDTSGSFGVSIPGSRPVEPGDDLGPSLGDIDAAIDNWVLNFANTNPDWTGNVYKYIDNTERWVNYPQVIANTTYDGQSTFDKDIIVISFCNEAHPTYHEFNLTGTVSNPTSQFLTDYDFFTGSNLSGNNTLGQALVNEYNSFVGIHYPIVFGPGTTTGNLLNSRTFVQHSLAALKGTSFSISEINELNENLGFDVGEWDILTTSLQGNNPYPDDGLVNYGWVIKEDRFVQDDGNVIDSDEFQEDINELLLGTLTVEIIEVEIRVPKTEFLFIDGTPTDDVVQANNSWTMSFDLKTQKWVSWHSYIPNFYFYVNERFYSWQHGTNNLWKHNVRGLYQTYYGTYYPHIIEYVSLSSPLVTRIWDWLLIQTQAKRWIPEMESYVEERDITHNKMMVYNNRQNSGVLTLKPKASTIDENYMSAQIQNNVAGEIIIERVEDDWTINDFRDVRIDYTVPMFDASLMSLQDVYYIDKILNESSISFEKEWTELESFRSKFLVIRFIFDNFDNIRIITNYSVEPETVSIR